MAKKTETKTRKRGPDKITEEERAKRYRVSNELLAKVLQLIAPCRGQEIKLSNILAEAGYNSWDQTVIRYNLQKRGELTETSHPGLWYIEPAKEGVSVSLDVPPPPEITTPEEPVVDETTPATAEILSQENQHSDPDKELIIALVREGTSKREQAEALLAESEKLFQSADALRNAAAARQRAIDLLNKTTK